jgi:hypothetical protein
VTTRAPSDLSRSAGRLWRDIHERYELEPHHEAILARALEAFDRACDARDLTGRQAEQIDG